MANSACVCKTNAFCNASSNLNHACSVHSQVGFQIQKINHRPQLSKMIVARGAISMALTPCSRFRHPFHNEEALAGTDFTVRDEEDEGARANQGPVTTSNDHGVKGILVSSNKYVII